MCAYHSFERKNYREKETESTREKKREEGREIRQDRAREGGRSEGGMVGEEGRERERRRDFSICWLSSRQMAPKSQG